jgi:hypothetical protein
VNEFFRCAKERLDKDPNLAIILFSSNEGIKKLILDPTTHHRFLRLHALPACGQDELVLCLSEMLQTAQIKSSGSQDAVTFLFQELDTKTMAALSADTALLQSLVGRVVAMVPQRYAFSLRFWDFLLCTVRCEEVDEDKEVVCKVMKTLSSVRFMQRVVQQLDLEASGAFRDYALAHSPQLEPEDDAKLVKWVASAAASPGPVPYVPEGFPSRLALLQSLKAVDRGFVDKMIGSTLDKCKVTLLELKAEPAPAGVSPAPPICLSSLTWL